MDHVYAATAPLSASTDVQITPPPGTGHLLDHSFARSPSDSPQPAAASSSKEPSGGRPTRSAANKGQDQTPQTRNISIKQQDLSQKTSKRGTKEEQQTKVSRAEKTDMQVNSRSLVDQHVQRSEAKKAATPQHKPLEQDHAPNTEKGAEKDHIASSKKVAGKDHTPESKTNAKKEQSLESKKVAGRDHTPESKRKAKEDNTLKSKKVAGKDNNPVSKKMAGKQTSTPDEKTVTRKEPHTPEAKNVNGKQDCNPEFKRVTRQKSDTPEPAIVSGKPDVAKMKSVTEKQESTPETKKEAVKRAAIPEKIVTEKQDINPEAKKEAVKRVASLEKSVTEKQDINPEAVKRVASLEKRVSGRRASTDSNKVTAKEDSIHLTAQPDKITEPLNVTGKQDNNSDKRKVKQDHVSQTNTGDAEEDKSSEPKKADGKQNKPETKMTTAKKVNIVQKLPVDTKSCSAEQKFRVIGKSDSKQTTSLETKRGVDGKDNQDQVEEHQQKETNMEVTKQSVTLETSKSAGTEGKQSAAEERLPPRITRKQSESNSSSDSHSMRDNPLFDGSVTRLEKPNSPSKKQTCETSMTQPSVCEPHSEDVAVDDLEQQECIESRKSHVSNAEAGSLTEQQSSCNTDGKHDVSKEKDTSDEVQGRMVAVSTCDRSEDNNLMQDVQDLESNQSDPNEGSLVPNNDNLNKSGADLLPELSVNSDASNPVWNDHQLDKTSEPVDGTLSGDTSCITTKNTETHSQQNSQLDKMSDNVSEPQTESIDIESMDIDIVSMDLSEKEKSQTEGTKVEKNLGERANLPPAEKQRVTTSPAETSDNSSAHAEKLASVSCENEIQTDNDEHASIALKNLCDAIQLKKKVPDSPANENGGNKIKILVNPQRKRTASEAGLNASPSPSVDLVSSQNSVSSQGQAASSGSSTSIVSSGGSKPKVVKACVAKAAPHELPLPLEEYHLPMKKYGWKREMVVRGVYDDVKLKYPPADIYYFTPNGKKLRSGVQIATYLSENPSVPLKQSNFTFLKKSICEEPWEIIRGAGRGRGGRSTKSEKSGASPPKKKPKIIFTKKPAISVSLARSESSTPRVIKPTSKSSFVRLDLTAGESETDDDDFDPWNEDKSPNWNRKRRRTKFSKEPGPAPETEVLIQSMPEPEIVIDRADESLYSLNTCGTEGGGGGVPPKAPRMVLLPEDIKEECEDSEGEGGGTGRGVGSVHVYQSPDKTVKPRSKPTARKSTTPRIAFNKPRPSKVIKKNSVPESMGQLCTNTCPGMAGVDPTLQCCVCMCLFHQQCVGMNHTLILPGSFKCSRCKDVTSTETNPTWAFQPRMITSQSGSGPPQKHKVFYLRASVPPPVLPSQAFSAPTLMAGTPLINVSPSLPVGTTMDSMLRNLTTLPNPGLHLPVRPAPLAMPHLIPGVIPSTTLQNVTYHVIPPRQARPLPRLKAAPGVTASSLSHVSTAVTLLSHPSTSLPSLSTAGGNLPQAQMMTLPASLLSRLNLSQPLTVKLNNSQVVVPPSCFIGSQDGLKVLLPPSTFHVPPNSNTVTVSNNVLPTTTTTTAATVTGSSATSSRLSAPISSIPSLPISPIPPLAASCIPSVTTSSTPSSTSCLVSPATTSSLSSSIIQCTVASSIPSTISSVDTNTRQGSPVDTRQGSPITARSGDTSSRQGSPVDTSSRQGSPVDTSSRQGSPVDTSSRQGSPIPANFVDTSTRQGSPISANFGDTNTKQGSPITANSGDASSRQGSPITVSSTSTIVSSSSADACSSPVDKDSSVRMASPSVESDLEIVSCDMSNSTSVSNKTGSSNASVAPSSDKPSSSSALTVTPSSDKTVSEEPVMTCRCRKRINPAKCLIQRLHGGFDCMLSIFQFLTIPDLLRAGQVCRTWQRIFHERCLWQTVSLKGLVITDWEKAASFLSSVRTRSLMLHQVHPESVVHGERMKFWDQMKGSLVTLTPLRQVEFDLVPSYILHSVAESLAGLHVLRADRISDFWGEMMRTTETKLDIGIFGGLSELEVLHLRGASRLALPSFSFSGSLSNLANLKHLRSLSLTSLCALRDSEFSFLKDMKQLQMLELGDCLNWTEQTYGLVGELSNLNHLRLECGGKIPDCGLADAISKLTKLERLELIMFTIPSTLRTALSQLRHLHTLIVWPRAHHAIHPARVNTQAVKAVLTAQTLKRLDWGVVNTQPDNDDDHPVPPTDHILMLHPKAAQAPDRPLNDQDMISVSFHQFTEILSSSLPSTTIKVVNTHIAGQVHDRFTELH